MKKPVVIVLVALLGIAVFTTWSAREWIGWQLVSADAAPVTLGPARLLAPQSLPARVTFSPDGDVKLSVGQIDYDAMSLTAQLTPLDEHVVGDDATRVLKELQLALLADEPSAGLEERLFGAHPGFVARTKVGKATSILVVVVAGSALARLEIAVRGAAPGKWRDAADAAVDSFSLVEVAGREGLWLAFAERGEDECEGGDAGACLWAGKGAWQRGKLDEARAVLERGIKQVGPIEVLWDEAKSEMRPSMAALAAGETAPMPLTKGPLRRLRMAADLHLLLGDLEVAEGKHAAAVELFQRAWRYESEGRIARRMLEEAVPLVDEESAARWAETARHVDDRFGQDPTVALAAARVASRAGAYDVARAIAQRVYEGAQDMELRRDVVGVPLSAPPSLEPLLCGKGTKGRRTTTVLGTTEEACVDRAGKRQGQGRVWFTTTGYLLEEVTFKDDEKGAPDRRYWENGQQQRASLVDERGGVTVERWDPFGRPLASDDDVPPNDAAVEVEGR